MKILNIITLAISCLYIGVNLQVPQYNIGATLDVISTIELDKQITDLTIERDDLQKKYDISKNIKAKRVINERGEELLPELTGDVDSIAISGYTCIKNK